MDSKPQTSLAALCALLLIGGCTWFDKTVTTINDKGYGDDSTLGYWYSTRMTADTAPDPVKAQQILEDDLVACGYQVRDQRHWAAADDPVSDQNGDVVDHKGVARADTSLPTVFQLSDCMGTKGWVRLKHYYTAPY